MKKRQLLLTLLLLFSTNYILAQQLSPVIPKNFQSLKKKSLNDTIKRNYPSKHPSNTLLNKIPGC